MPLARTTHASSFARLRLEVSSVGVPGQLLSESRSGVVVCQVLYTAPSTTDNDPYMLTAGRVTPDMKSFAPTIFCNKRFIISVIVR